VDNTATLFLDFAQPPRGSAQLNELLANLAKVTAEIETMQGRYFNSFARPIDSLLGTMAEHAAVLRKQLGETGGKPAAHQSEDPGALSSVQERSPQDPRSKLYVSVSENELDQLVTVKNCLLDLQTQASKDSTRQQFVEAIKALEVYMSIIKGELPLPVALLKAHALPRLNPEEPAVPKIDLKVDDLIRILANYKATVQAGVLSNWRVSAKLDDMLSLVHAEFKECLARELTGRQIIIQSIFFNFLI